MAWRYGAAATYRGDATVTPWLQCAHCARHILRLVRAHLRRKR